MSERLWPGKFVTIEGNDGAGKTTQTGFVVAHALDLGVDVVGTKEPGGILETLLFRGKILDPRVSEEGEWQLLLFGAERVVHIQEQILPALLSGKLIVCDRFSGSSRAYQHERGIPMETIDAIDAMARGVLIDGERVELSPDLTILVDVPAEVGIARMAARAGERTYFDVDDVSRHNRRRQIYLELAQRFDWEVIDGTKNKEGVFIDILTTLENRGILPKGENNAS